MSNFRIQKNLSKYDKEMVIKNKNSSLFDSFQIDKIEPDIKWRKFQLRFFVSMLSIFSQLTQVKIASPK